MNTGRDFYCLRTISPSFRVMIFDGRDSPNQAPVIPANIHAKKSEGVLFLAEFAFSGIVIVRFHILVATLRYLYLSDRMLLLVRQADPHHQAVSEFSHRL